MSVVVVLVITGGCNNIDYIKPSSSPPVRCLPPLRPSLPQQLYLGRIMSGQTEVGLRLQEDLVRQRLPLRSYHLYLWGCGRSSPRTIKSRISASPFGLSTREVQRWIVWGKQRERG